jgi:hypothetical protein
VCTFGLKCEGLFAGCSFYHGTQDEVCKHIAKKIKSDQ